MPINWLTALKILPWSDMIEYAPKVVSGAQKVWQRVKSGKDEAAVADANTLLPNDPQAELALLKHELQALQAQQLELTNVVKQLADQNQRLVDAVSVLRVRSRLLLLGFALTACALLALWYTAH
jgi:hypothetical protein